MAKKNLAETVNVVASKATKCATKKRSRSMKEIISQMRKMANEKWQIVERSGRYRRCALQKSYQSVANDIEDTLMDGTFISLKEHSMMKPGNVQKRQLRRIVEKRKRMLRPCTIFRDIPRSFASRKVGIYQPEYGCHPLEANLCLVADLLLHSLQGLVPHGRNLYFNEKIFECRNKALTLHQILERITMTTHFSMC